MPYICHDLKTRLKRMFDQNIDEQEVLRSNRVFVACQTDDDLPYVLKYSGEDQLVIGSDYGHADTSAAGGAAAPQTSRNRCTARHQQDLDDNAACSGLN